MSLSEKYQRLQELLINYGSVAVAFSGGVDSTLLLKAARDCLGRDKVVAITLISPLFPAEEVSQSEQLARQLGVVQLKIQLNDLEPVELISNGPLRCYHCKKHLFRKIVEQQELQGFAVSADGSNLDDLQDYRPGRKALDELKIRSPLLEAELSKQEIRELSRVLQLMTWDKPALACLASRIPYGTPLDTDLLQRIARCEQWLRTRGFSQCRVRYHQQIARIELEPAGFSLLSDSGLREELVVFFKKNEFDYVTLDLQGYRSGSMNTGLT